MPQVPQYRRNLPQLKDARFLTDAGLETTLLFLRGIDLPLFAAFDLLRDAERRAVMREVFAEYIGAAREQGVGIVLETPTWRASRHWATELGFSAESLAHANQDAVEFMVELRQSFETPDTPIVISGCLGPMNDGYSGHQAVTPEEAESYHREQILTFRDTAVDMICALTLGSTEEATGVVRAAQAADLPVAISFTVETDGRLPNGTEVSDAIAEVDQLTSGGPVYYMLNCAHPDHFRHLVEEPPAILKERLRGLRCNASRKSHEELDESSELDRGNPEELAIAYASLLKRWPQLRVMGGCCGTDAEHLKEIAARFKPNPL